MSWLQEYLESVEELESPKSYFYWSILTTISSVVAKRMWVDRGGVYKLYPNIYTFLISKRSGLRKGVPINVAKKLAYELGKVRVIDGQNTVQGMIKELAKVHTFTSGHIIKNAEGFFISGEFASFIIQDGAGSSLTTLTDLYDAQYHEQGWKKTLASQEQIELKNLCLTGLFAANETHFFDSVPKNAITGGFLARTFCIYEDKRNTLNSLTKPITKQINYPKIVTYLSEISRMEGAIVAETRALKAFDDWYYPFSEKDYEEEDKTGTSERLGDNVWKAAMLISLAHDHQKIIYEEDMVEAITKTMETFHNIKKLLLGGTSDNKNINSITMRMAVACMLENEVNFECSKKKILRKGVGVFGVYDLDGCIEHLLQAKMITQEKRGQETYYKLTPMVIKQHLEQRKNGTGGVK